MSMHVDFEYPRQIEDVASVKATVKSFEKKMRKMMLLMKDVGNTLEGVSLSFSSMTTLNYADNKEVRRYVDGFNEHIVKMKEGVPFQDYNRLVHEEVILPVNELQTAIKGAEQAIAKRDKTYGRYTKSKKKVDKIERKYAASNKVLQESKSHPAEKAKREKYLSEFHDADATFQSTFTEFIRKVEVVTQSTMKRYLQLNAGYMEAVIQALTSSDPSIEDHIDLYRRQLHADRASEIARREKEVHAEVNKKAPGTPKGGSAATFNYNYDPNTPMSKSNRMQKSPPASRLQGGKTPKSVTRAGQSKASPPSDSALRARLDLEAAEGVKPAPNGPPVASEEVQRDTPAVPVKEEPRPTSFAEPATMPNGGHSTKTGGPLQPTDREASAASIEEHKDKGVFGPDSDDDGGDSYFGSVSQVNEAQHLQQQRLRMAALASANASLGVNGGGGRESSMDQKGATTVSVGGAGAKGGDEKEGDPAPPPQYRFAPSTVGGASQVSVAKSGYLAAQGAAMNNKFMEGLEKPSEDD